MVEGKQNRTICRISKNIVKIAIYKSQKKSFFFWIILLFRFLFYIYVYVSVTNNGYSSEYLVNPYHLSNKYIVYYRLLITLADNSTKNFLLVCMSIKLLLILTQNQCIFSIKILSTKHAGFFFLFCTVQLF